MGLPSSFSNNTNPTGVELDANFAALGALTPIPCAASGTNTIALTPVAFAPAVAAYANYGQFTYICPATNTGPATAQVGALAALAIQKDTIGGPAALTGGEMVQGTAVVLMYDTSINGFHLINQPSRAVRSHTTTASIGFGALLPQSGSTATVTLGGVSIGDVIGIGFPANPTISVNMQGSVPFAGTVVVQAFNMSAATVTASPGAYRITATGYSA